MLDKHQITGTVPEDVAYLKYNYITSELIIGGHADCIDFIDGIVEGFINKHGLENTHTQRSRIRYSCKMKKKIYRALKLELKEDYTDGFTKIDNLERRL